MNHFLHSNARAFKAEWLKLKRTGTLWICLGSAAFIPLVNTLVIFFVDISGRDQNDNGWQRMIESDFRAFNGFFFPLFLVLMVTRIVYIEHRSDTWKLLETQPVSRFSIFFSKWFLVILISLVSLIALFVFAAIGGLLLLQFKAGKDFTHNFIEWEKVFRLIIRTWVASLGLISVQYFLALLIRSFAWPVIIGLVAIIVGSIFAAAEVFSWFPYSGPSLTASFINGSKTGSFLIPHEMLSVAWAALFLWLSFQLFRRRKFVLAFFQPLHRVAITAGVLIAFGILFWFVNRPSVLPSYGHTVIAGTIQSPKVVENLIIYKLPHYDTLLVVPVKNGKFHLPVASKLETSIYTARVGNARFEIYFGNGDSIYIDWKILEKGGSSHTVTGTRLAENSYLVSNKYDYMYRMLSDYAYTYNPQQYSSSVLSIWIRNQEEIEQFKTVDNIKPAKDFIDLQQKFLAIKLLTLTEIEYPRVMAVYYPNDTTKSVAGLKDMKDKINFNDDDLAVYQDYREYVSAILSRKAMATNQSYLTVMANEVPSERLKNYLAYDEIQKNLSLINDSLRREVLLNSSLSILTDEKLRENLIDMNNRLNRLRKGKKAPDFLAENLNGDSYTLAKFEKRYLVIDLWATWCGPCKAESPYFDQYADQYTDSRIAFVSVSVDQDKNAWRMEAREKSKRVLQLWAKNAETDFMKGYSAGTIPRFILIDPKGNILNAQMPYPSDPQFEIELQKEIPSLRLTAY